MKCSDQKTYLSKVAENAQKPRGRHLTRPHQPFWGPLLAILDFTGIADLQAVSVKKIQRLKTVEIAEKLLKKKHIFYSNIWSGGISSQDSPKISWVNQEVLGLTRKFLVKPEIRAELPG